MLSSQKIHSSPTQWLLVSCIIEAMTLSTAIGKFGISVTNMLKPDAVPTILPTIAQKASRSSATFKKREWARVRKEIKSQFFSLKLYTYSCI